ncbi:DUF1707 domain-containing protein [Plantactinospora sp. B24E8]|uniref:DUF1707 SHOCT-like domain-containing protein n=1 Tax=Plantactinospora sp. B24E8 TaxID=3153567 RepID=UPI00325DBF6C
MEQRDRMRAADSDRAAVADRLRRALDEGRLDLNEYDNRLQRTYAAKTYGDLDGLLADLPAPAPEERSRLAPTGTGGVAVPGGSTGPTPSSPGTVVRDWLRETWGPYFSTVAVVVGIWAVICVMAGDINYFWPGWVAGPWGVVLLVVTVSGLANGAPQRRAARRAARERARAERRERRRTERPGDGEAA